MFDIRRSLKETGKFALRKVFEWGQLLGFDLLPRHFYSEIPFIRELRNSTHWKAPYSMLGVQGAEIETQIDFVRECCLPPIVEEIKRNDIHANASRQNGAIGFGEVEADFLYAFIATQKPSQIFQIGCGVSTAVCLAAAEYAGYRPEVLCLEPYPTDYLLQEAKQGRITLVKEKAQSYDPKCIETLDSDLLFFVDSSHTLGPAGEVSRIILEMLPRLKRGAWIHFHDIKFPYDYDRHVLDSSLFFQHESVLLHAFLSGNSKFSIRASLSMLHYYSPEVLAEYFPKYNPAENDEGLNRSEGHFPSSTFLEVIE